MSEKKCKLPERPEGFIDENGVFLIRLDTPTITIIPFNFTRLNNCNEYETTDRTYMRQDSNRHNNLLDLQKEIMDMFHKLTDDKGEESG